MADFPAPVALVAFGAITGSFTTLITLPAGHAKWGTLTISNTTNGRIDVNLNGDGTTINDYIEAGNYAEYQRDVAPIVPAGGVVQIKSSASLTSGDVYAGGFC
jgi:hypothetical protein